MNITSMYPCQKSFTLFALFHIEAHYFALWCTLSHSGTLFRTLAHSYRTLATPFFTTPKYNRTTTYENYNVYGW